MRKIQNHYLYWDKIKYKYKDKDPHLVWQAVKALRFMQNSTVHFGSYAFYIPRTDFIQQSLHYFDLYAGGSLTSNIGIAPYGRNKFVMSAIMEEAIAMP